MIRTLLVFPIRGMVHYVTVRFSHSLATFLTAAVSLHLSKGYTVCDLIAPPDSLSMLTVHKCQIEI